MKFFSPRSSDTISRLEPGFEETERRTPWTGVLLLIIMFIAGLFFGWRAVDDLSRVPSRPADLSYCSSRYGTYKTEYQPTSIRSPLSESASVYYGKYSSDEAPCNFNDLEQSHGIPDAMNQRRAVLEAIRNAPNTERQYYERARQRREELSSQYDLRLQERQAGVPSATPESLAFLQQQVAAADREEQRLSALLDQKILTERTQSNELKTLDDRLRAAYQPVFTEQQKRLRWYEFKVFLLQMLFVLPLFLLALKAYLRQLKKNSPYTIILTAIVGVMGVLVLRVLLMWFWDLFLARLIEVLWNWIQNFELLRSIVFYLGMVLSFSIFGGAVYYLQKRIFDPRRLAIRRFRSKQCPHCQTTLDVAGAYCPNCGYHVRTTCSQCGRERYIDLPYCPNCGQATPPSSS